MKRKYFIRNVLFGFAAHLVPEILTLENNNKIEWTPFPLLPPKLTDKVIADLKLQHHIIKSKPNGKYIDMRYLRNYLKNNK